MNSLNKGKDLYLFSMINMLIESKNRIKIDF